MEGTAGISKETKYQRSWRGFQTGDWCRRIDVRDFIVHNVTPYSGDEQFLRPPSARTDAMIFPSMTIVKVISAQIVGLLAASGAGG